MSAPEPGSEFWAVSQDIKDDLEKHTKQRRSFHNRFVSRDDLSKIWQKGDRIRKVLYTESLTPEEVSSIQDKFTAILSTLVSIDATRCLAYFRSLFLTSSITDGDLPLEREQIESFLPNQSELVSQFDGAQCEFCPTVISCTTPLQRVPSKSRLPFEKPPERLGTGGFGEVDLVTIAPRYWRMDNQSTSNSIYKVACKKFNFKEAFIKEHKNLSILKESLTTQRHILQHYTAVEHNPHGYYIFFPYAEHGDLYQFLYGGAGSYELRSQFPCIPGTGDRAIFKPLLHQCWALACAIQWLHDNIQIDGEHIMCAHLDLKPDNILIMNDDSSIVGKWTISDFGISVLEPQKLDASRALSVGGCYREPTIEVNPHRGRGTYRPPEAINRIGSTATTDKIGRRADIWAYGCIFTEVLAWAIGRREGVHQLAEERQRGATSDYYWDESFGQSLTPQMTGFKVRGSVVQWLDHVQTSPERVVGDWVKTVKDILIIDKECRPKAQKLVAYVTSVYKSCDLPRDPVPQSLEPSSDPSLWQSHSPPSNWSLSRTSSQQSIRSTESEEPPKEPRSMLPTKLIPHDRKHGIVTYLSRTMCQGNVPLAVLSNDKVGILSLNLPGRVIEEVRSLALFGELENADVAIEGQYLAAWGHCKAKRKRMLHVGDIDSGFERNLPVNIDAGSVMSVAVSPRGTFALVQDKEIILLSWSRLSVPHVQRTRATLALPNSDQFFTQAIFNDKGDFLFAWARDPKQESLYVWKVEGRADQPDFAVHYSLVGHATAIPRI
ncbi:hypothetical protein ASPBRDRAFT_25201 [Aspergillus brasiliensis CBS 101740]|uniref:Protein kinase domain-containing protein n=1 Tax=Aspergillus brasiliensis (strain CBS 101740 / IMI 381727 / IBT 21946) TaxID=767769 RepID=A0A1L9V131_ASPBC|nr:hypothetical protein ASPBRDRAFT_25201 [Aspergillus brasiliensis CBS 101740]